MHKWSKNRSSIEIRRFQRKIYIYAFCEGLIFWYSIEKLFEQSIGFGLGTIIMLGIIAQASKIIFEIPSSILADKWNRRNMLMIGTSLMLLASVGLTFAKSPLAYGTLILLWTLYMSFKSGTDTAFIYDSLRNIGGEGVFRQTISRYGTYEYIGLIISGLSAGAIVTATNLVVPFWLTVIPLVIGLASLRTLQEPPIGREEQNAGTNWLLYLGDAMKEVKRNKLSWIVLLYGVVCGMQLIWYEYYQLYALAVNTPTYWFGGAIAALCLGLIAGAEIARKWKLDKEIVIVVWLALGMTHLVSPWIGQYAKYFAILFITMMAMKILQVGLIEVINQNIASLRRATIISLAGALSQVLFLGLAFVFKAVIEGSNVQEGILVSSLPLILVGLIDITRNIPWLVRPISMAKTVSSDITDPGK